MRIVCRSSFFGWLWSLETRPAEAMLALILVSRGMAIWMPGDRMHSPVYEPYIMVAPEWAWGFLTLAAGLFIFWGVAISGRRRRSSYLRILGAGLAGSIFTMLAVTFATRSEGAILEAFTHAPIALSGFWCGLNIASKR